MASAGRVGAPGLVRGVAGGEVADGVAQAANAAAVEEERARERGGKFHLPTSARRNPGFAPGPRLAFFVINN
jgi:hypothetical protein